MIGIIGAMKVETDSIVACLSDKKQTIVSGVTFTTGRLGENELVVATCGVGKVYAAMCAQTMILTFSPEAIINVGVAGALAPELHICDLVIADRVVQHDMDTSPLGDPVGMVSGVDLVYFPCNTSFNDRIRASALALGIHALQGTVASGDQFIAAPERKAAIRAAFSADACEMEGAAIGQVCYVNDTPFCVLRSISDGAGGDGAMDFVEFCDAAAAQTTRLIQHLFA